MSGQKIIDGLQEAIDGKIGRITEYRVWREGECPYCQGTGKQMRAEAINATTSEGRHIPANFRFDDSRFE